MAPWQPRSFFGIVLWYGLAARSCALIEDEIAAYGYFGKSTAHGVPQSVARYVNLKADEFEELAFSGRPFVVEDGGKDQPFVGWKCDDFRQRFPNGIVKVEYVKGIKAEKSIQEPWEKEQHPIPNADPGGPQFAPWYWGIKAGNDEEEADTVFQGGKNPLPDVQSKMKVPPFMRSSKGNKQEVFNSPEFWFSMPQAGATMHMDGHCESTFAIQLSGTRKWRLGWVPPVPNSTMYKSGTYGDGAIYGKDYHPPLEAVVSEGEGIFMPSAFLHETSNVGDTCAVSLTFQFKDPVPARYFRQSLRHLRRSGDFEECWELLGMVAGLSNGRGPPGKAPNLGSVDADGDGQFTKQEAKGYMQRAAHAFHDVNGDGVVTADELEAGWNAWKDADKESKKTKKTRPKSFKYLDAPRRKEL